MRMVHFSISETVKKRFIPELSSTNLLYWLSKRYKRFSRTNFFAGNVGCLSSKNENRGDNSVGTIANVEHASKYFMVKLLQTNICIPANSLTFDEAILQSNGPGITCINTTDCDLWFELPNIVCVGEVGPCIYIIDSSARFIKVTHDDRRQLCKLFIRITTGMGTSCVYLMRKTHKEFIEETVQKLSNGMIDLTGGTDDDKMVVTLTAVKYENLDKSFWNLKPLRMI